MPLLSPVQRTKISTHSLTRDGIDLPANVGAGPLACWNFALTGTLIGMADARSPQSITDGLFATQMGNVDPPIWATGLAATATIVHYPGCGAELADLNNHIVAAVNGSQNDQRACFEAAIKIMLRMNGFQPNAAPNNDYMVHVKATTWFGWDHWSLSFRAVQPGRPRVFIQTTTGEPLSHACTGIWDEGLPWHASIGIQGLHQAQINMIDHVPYGPLCVVCGAQHGLLPSSPLNAWHRCQNCRAAYCPTHGGQLPGKRGMTDRTRTCGMCNVGRTALQTYV